MSAVVTTKIEEALRLFHGGGEVFEVRILGVSGTPSGYFNDPGKAAAAIAKYDGKAKGVYHTINPVNPRLLERAPNRLRTVTPKGEATADADISRRCWVPVDIDFTRPTDTNATDDEVRAADVLSKKVRAYLEDEHGWPAPVKVMSGNGVHLLYALELPPTDVLIKLLLERLAKKFNVEDGAHVDTSVHNAARIMKVPGTMVCKGPPSDERPHRRSHMVGAVPELLCVPQSALEAVAAPPPVLPPEALSSTGNGKTPWTVKDVEDHLTAWGLEQRGHSVKDGDDVWELKVCPYNSEHDRGEAYVMHKAGGALIAGCPHKSCTWDWKELRARFDAEYDAGYRAQLGSGEIVLPGSGSAAAGQDAANGCSTPQNCSVGPFPDGFCIDWASGFWEQDSHEEDWVYPDVLARGRGHALYATHKAGKSLLMLYIAAKLATGDEAIAVLYLDYEMSQPDVKERLASMGYDSGTDLSRLCYASLPTTLSPLDMASGAQELMARVDALQTFYPDHHLVVIIDTISRAVSGEENSADTYRAFYTHTGIALKSRGVTWARLDHSGKDATAGQRGSSAKGDDVDVVWELTVTQSGVCLTRKLSRMNWVPEKVTLGMFQEPLRYLPVAKDWPAGTADCAFVLDQFGAPLNITVKAAIELLKEAEVPRRTAVVAAALRWRREIRETSPETSCKTEPGNGVGNAEDCGSF